MKNGVERFPTDVGVDPTENFNMYRETVVGQPPPSAEDVQIKPVSHKIPRKGKGLSPFNWGLLWGTTFTLTAAISATVGATITLISPLPLNIASLIQKAESSLTKASPKQKNDGWGSILQYSLARPVNILVMGIDRVPDAPKGSAEVFAGRSDTILLLRFEPTDNSVRMLSIPRDSRVEIPGVGFAKINDANVRGGPALTARVMSKTLNDVPIDRYVRVTSDAFKELVDLVGGIEVFVPYPMSYVDLTQKLEINLEAGWQNLNGEQAEQFARFRNDKYGDIGRVQRQQTLLKALQKRLHNPAILPRIPQAIRVLRQYIDTNLSLEEMLALANFGRGLDRDNIKMVMIPGRFSREDEYDLSFWIIYPNGRDRVMREYFDLETESKLRSRNILRSPNRVRIAIQNAADEPDLARRVVSYLAERDFHNVYLMKESPQLLQETEIIVQQGDLEAANMLRKVLGLGRVEASSIGDLDSDLTIRVGVDAKRLE
ncbi:MAG: LCP family protein [Xenococcaceae cyanobacterium]